MPDISTNKDISLEWCEEAGHADGKRDLELGKMGAPNAAMLVHLRLLYSDAHADAYIDGYYQAFP